jgi:putative heme degradation protein
MSTRVRIRQTDVASILKGAAKAGVDVQVNVKPDGTIEILTGVVKATLATGKPTLRERVLGR